MRTLFFKEVRGNLLWAFLALVALGAAEGWAVSQGVGRGEGLGTPCAPAFLLATTFGCAALGFGLALLQILPEQRPDRWALLVHRPLPRAAIFWGKAGAGLLLYVLATGLPLLLSAWWTATPGHVAAPFTAGMLLPGAIDLMAGAVYYFAGLAFALRDAKWKGSKGLPLLAAVAVSVWTHNTSFVPSLLVLLLAAGTLLSIVARDAFLDFGLKRGPSPAARGALGTLLGGALFLFGGMFLGYWTLLGSNTGTYTSRDYQIGADGALYVVTERRLNWAVTSRKIEDLDGHPVAEGPGRPPHILPMAYALRINFFASYRPDYRTSNAYAYPIYDYNGQDDRGERMAWYYVPARRRMEAYGERERRLVGTLGPDGYASSGKAGRPFHSALFPLSANGAFAFKEGTYWIDTHAQSSRLILSADETRRLLTISHVQTNDPNEPGAPEYLVTAVFSDSLRFLTPAGEKVGEVPFDPAYPPEHEAQAGLLKGPDGMIEFLIYYPPFVFNRDQLVVSSMPGALDRHRADGTLASRTVLPPLDPSGIFPASWKSIVAAVATPPIFAIPGVLPAATKCIPFAYGYYGGISFLKPGWQVWLARVGALFLGVACSIVTRRLLPRTDRRARLLIASAFLLGPWVVAAIWAVRERPRRVACPACGAPRLPEEETCDACGAAWPAPERNGLEIFEGEGTAA